MGQEVSNWNSINGNFLVYWIPYWMQDDVLDFADNNGYKIDISNFYYWSTHSQLTNSLHRWMYLTNPTETELISIINDIKTTYGSHPGFFNYTFGEETPVANSDYWPRVELISQKIHDLDPGRKSYMVSGGAPQNAFFEATPHLDILQMDYYPFWNNVDQKYSDQQSALDGCLVQYNNTSDRIKDRHTEWHPVIQAQREFRDLSNCPGYPRRPNIYELRVQAFLAISRGARGITSFVYGSGGSTSPEPPHILEPLSQEGLLMGNSSEGCTILGYAGLVDRDRLPYTAGTDPDGIPAFQNLTNLHNELQLIGPTLRKLRWYDAFPNTSIPSGNCAGIVNVTGDKIEIGTFKRMDQGVDSSIYFIVVNRVCNNEDGSVSSPQNVNISFNLNSVFTNWIVKEIGTSTSWVISKTGNFQTS